MRGRLERQLLAEGLVPLGIDEVGRGCLAGPVYAACVELDYHRLKRLSKRTRDLIRDSKTLSGKQRQSVLETIAACSIKSRIAFATVEEIEQKGIVGATFLAMHRAMSNFVEEDSVVLVDGNRPIPDFAGQQRTVVKGDNLCFAIAAASIIAKEARDAYMREQASAFPEYGFENHVGYGTKRHLDMISQHGICGLHRRNFAPVALQSEQRYEKHKTTNPQAKAAKIG